MNTVKTFATPYCPALFKVLLAFHFDNGHKGFSHFMEWAEDMFEDLTVLQGKIYLDHRDGVLKKLRKLASIGIPISDKLRWYLRQLAKEEIDKKLSEIEE